MLTGLYKGYTSHNYQTAKNFSVMDIDLVKLDLLSHIYTRKGERVMMPQFGTRIPDLVFEPLDGFTLAILEEDLRTVFLFDPRVQLKKLKVTPHYDLNLVEASALLYYVELNIQDQMNINITFEAS